MQERVIWIDNLKVIGILAVILGHIASPLGHFIYSWHMPLFFFLAGLFIKYDLTLKEFFYKDFTRLIIPYFIFAILATILETVKRVALNRPNLDYLNEFVAIFVWMDYPSLINTYGFVLWFLPSLFFARLLLFVINKKIESILIQFGIISLLFYISLKFNIIFGIDNALNAIVFVFMGSIFYRYYQNDKRLALLPFILVGLLYYCGVPELDIANKAYENTLINIIYSMGIIFVFISILKRINIKNKVLSIWGSNTMLLFIIHPYTNNIGHIIIDRFYFGEWYWKFLISIILLQIVLLIKSKFENKGIFKYV